MRTSLAAAALLAATIACSNSKEPAGPIAVKDLPNINADLALADIKKLASDEFEGRAPGSKGEELTVQYLTEQFKAAGLEPGNPDGTWTQAVPLVGISATDVSPLVVTSKSGKTRSFKFHDDFVGWSRRVQDQISLDKSPIVFAGYGVQAPESGWDDFKGMDVKGKTIVVLVNDPQVTLASDPSKLDPAVFNGKAMTYYGRWTYKFDHAAELGAAGVIIVHDTATAGYPFTVVQGKTGELFNLVAPNKNADKALLESWITTDGAREMFKMAGLDFDKEKARAATKAFTPVDMNMSASLKFTQKMRTVNSRNVVAKLPGADPKLKDEYVIFSAHWDHFGIGQPVNGDNIYNGAMDDASGIASLIETARLLKTSGVKTKRSVVFVAVTAEEKGLLGSRYFAARPTVPFKQIVADLNLDMFLPLYALKVIEVQGLAESSLGDTVREAAKTQGVDVQIDREPEQNRFIRSDQYSFIRKGIPSLAFKFGYEFGSPEETIRRNWVRDVYHKPNDDTKQTVNLEAAATFDRVIMTLLQRVANDTKRPTWNADSFFKRFAAGR